MKDPNQLQRKPEWLKIRLASGGNFKEVKDLVRDFGLHTVCQSARCPNIGDCWSRRTATFMILGNVCTRNCRFCAVEKGKPFELDPDEPQRVAQAVYILNLRHVVITSVTRDDLEDGGASEFAKTIRAIREKSTNCSVEVLIPDFSGKLLALQKVFEAKPDILNHNLEVVPRLYPMARPQADFKKSFSILQKAKKEGFITKTGIMIGLGETWSEIVDLMRKLADIHLDILTIGQYLQPSLCHLPVEKFYEPFEFLQLKKIGEQLGISYVESGPLVRSSYHADQQIQEICRAKG